jgi:hypothetical protein
MSKSAWLLAAAEAIIHVERLLPADSVEIPASADQTGIKDG